MADLTLTVDYSQLKAANKEITKTGGAAQKSASVFETAFKKVEAQQKKALNDVRQQLAFSKRLEAQKQKEAQAAAQSAALVQKQEERLRHKYVEGYTAMNIYSKELNDLAVARKKDIITAEQQKEAVKQLNAQMAAGTGVFANAATGMQIVGKRANRTGVLAQQAGYQFGDFAVQVQSGTDPMVAFGQQATQLIGTFSMLAKTTKGIAIFSALGVLVPVLTAVGAALIRMRKESDNTEEKLKDFQSRIKSLDESLKDFLRTQEAASKGLSVDMLLGTDSLEQAEKDLDSLLQKMKELTASAGADGQAAFSDVTKYNGLLADRVNLHREIAKAQTRVDQLKKKELQDINSTIEAEVKRQKLTRLELKYGKDSAEYRKEEVAQRLRSLELSLKEANVSSKTIEYLVKQEESLLKQETSQTRLLNIDEARLAVIGLYYEYLERIEGQIEERRRGVDKIKEAEAAANKTLEQRLELAQIELKFGKDSEELAAAVARHAREAFIARVAEQGILGNNLKELLKLYDQVVAAEGKVPKTPKTSTTRGSVDNVAKLQKEIELERALVGKVGEALVAEEARQRVIEALGDQYKKTSKSTIKGLQDQIIKTEELKAAEDDRVKKLKAAEDQQEDIANAIAGGFGDAFMSIVDGTKSAKEAFSDMARHIIARLFEILVIEQMVQSIAGGIKMAFGGASGTAAASASVPSVESMDGGGYTGSGSRSGGLDGRGGFMAMLHPRETIIDHTKPNQAMSQQPVVIHQNFNFAANGDDSVKRIIAQEAPKIAQMTQQQILDQRRRGGQMKAAFS